MNEPSHRATSLRRSAWLAAFVCASIVASAGGAQTKQSTATALSPDEELLIGLVQENQFAAARTKGETLLRRHPNSIVVHYMLGHLHRVWESNAPKAVYHLNRARELAEAAIGRERLVPGVFNQYESIATFHYKGILHELAYAYGDVENHEQKLATFDRYNRVFEPDIVAERAWSLMKLGRYAEARDAAERGIQLGGYEQLVGLNALCAITFEGGDDGESYEACKRAALAGSLSGEPPSVTDLTNLAEAERSLFKISAAEAVLKRATQLENSGYGNPWMDLADIYVREGRFAEALDAYRQIPAYRAMRPANVRDSDRSETRRSLAAFLIVIGRPTAALRFTEKAVTLPDRRGHNSRDSAQDLALAALMDRRAHLDAAEMVSEEAVAKNGFYRARAWLDALQHRARAWLAARNVRRALSDDRHIVGIFRIGTAHSSILPPWLAGDLVKVLGAGVTANAIQKARSLDKRPAARAYYDAFALETWSVGGDHRRVLNNAQRIADALPHEEALLRARLLALAAESANRLSRSRDCGHLTSAALKIDPGVFRRLGLAIRVQIRGIEQWGRRISIWAWPHESRRFDAEPPAALTLDLTGTPQVCLHETTTGTAVRCVELDERAPDETELQDNLFSPGVRLGDAEIQALDNAPRPGQRATPGVP